MHETQLAVVNHGSVTAELREAPWIMRIEDHPAWPLLSRLPMMLKVGVPLNRFRVRDLLALKAGQTLESAWPQTRDIPVAVGHVRLSWSEIEVSGQKICVRLTQLI